MGNYPDFVLYQRGTLSITVIRPLAEDSIVRMLADPDHLFALPGCQIVKDQRKIKIARIEVEIGGALKTVYLKRYNAFSWRYRLVSLFKSSGALRSWKGAGILADSAIRTARPLAAVDSRSWGMLNGSFFLSEEVKAGKTADAYWRDNLLTLSGKEGIVKRRNFLQGLGELFHCLHSKNVYHNDLKDANILVSADAGAGAEQFFLLDLEGIRRYRKLNRRRRIKNLVQLNRTLGKYLRAADKARFLKSYLGPAFTDRFEKRIRVGRVLNQSRKLDRLRNVTDSSRLAQ